MLPVDVNSDDYRFNKTLNMDVKLKQTSDISNHWDIQMENGDYVNVTGKESLHNAICIAIMTRWNELSYIDLYDGFGCRVHELVKANKSELVRYKIELWITDVLDNMRRIRSVNEVTVKDSETTEYQVDFNVTNINDEIVAGSVLI